MEICDSCRQAFEDNGAEEDILEEVLYLGADIPDHCCAKVENYDEMGLTTVECDCGCHQ